MFSLFSPSHHSPSPTLSPPEGNPHIVILVFWLSKKVLWLTPSPSRAPAPSFLAAVSLFPGSKLLLLSCSLVYYVLQISPESEIMWYFSFTGWFNSLNIMLSRIDSKQRQGGGGGIHVPPSDSAVLEILCIFSTIWERKPLKLCFHPKARQARKVPKCIKEEVHFTPLGIHTPVLEN